MVQSPVMRGPFFARLRFEATPQGCSRGGETRAKRGSASTRQKPEVHQRSLVIPPESPIPFN